MILITTVNILFSNQNFPSSKHEALKQPFHCNREVMYDTTPPDCPAIMLMLFALAVVTKVWTTCTA